MKVRRFDQTRLSRQSKERARLKVANGPDRGAIFVVFGKKVTIGRAETCDVIINDLKASREHAEIFLTNRGWRVQDLGSANGIFHNGNSTRAARVYSGDHLTVGESTFEFLSGEENTQLLESSPQDVEKKLLHFKAAKEEQDQRIRALTSFGGGSATPIPTYKDFRTKEGNARRTILLSVVLVLAAWVFLGEDPGTTASPKKAEKPAPVRDLATYLPSDVSSDVQRTATKFFKMGFRDFREKNYLRAKTQFETVLQIHPGHQLAKLYLRNCDQAIEEEVGFHLSRGKKSLESGRWKQSKGHYEAVLRLLHRDKTNENYLEAKDQLKDVEKKLKGEA